MTHERSLPQPEESKSKKENRVRGIKFFQIIRFVLLGTVLTFAKGDTNNPKKAALDLFSSDHPNSLVLKTPDDLVNQPNKNTQDSNIPDFLKNTNNNSDTGIAETTIILDIHHEEDGDIQKGTTNEVQRNNLIIKEEPVESEQEPSTPIVLGNGEYTQYIIDNYSQEPVGLSISESENSLVSPNELNETISMVFTTDPFMREVVTLFHPMMSEDEVTAYLRNYNILTGVTIDHYLTVIRSGSWGTTVPTVTEYGELRFLTISFRSNLIHADYVDDEWGSLTRLIREEFFQAHQYDVFSTLFNNGYLAEVSDLKTVNDMVGAVSTGNLRAFLELFPQQKILTDAGVGGNAYNFYIGDQLFEGYPAAKNTVDSAYNTLTEFITSKLNLQVTPESFLNPQFIVKLNNTFRDRYLEYYLKLGFPENEINIWCLVGMKRANSANPLDMPALLPLPTE